MSPAVVPPTVLLCGLPFWSSLLLSTEIGVTSQEGILETLGASAMMEAAGSENPRDGAAAASLSPTEEALSLSSERLSASVVMTDVKPVLNWANVCSPSILRTVRRTMIRFLIELLVRRTWFRQFDELYFVLNWLVMRCKLRPEHVADAQQTA